MSKSIETHARQGRRNQEEIISAALNPQKLEKKLKKIEQEKTPQPKYLKLSYIFLLYA